MKFLHCASRFLTLMSAVGIFAVAGDSACFAKTIGSRLHVNGYLTQAYGQTESDSFPVLGLDEDGTLDYRSAALLFRLDLYEKGKFFLQLSHEAIGSSPLQETKDDVEIDWAFYQHQFGNGTRLRLGRVPIPMGIYNELRDVGTVLEFYRPPVSIYFEGAFSAEAVDGGVISHEFFAQRPWGLSVDIYAGAWDRAEYIPPTIDDGRADDAAGAQLWLRTPIDGLRFGFAAQRFDQEGGALFLRTGDSDRFETYLFSADGDFGRFLFHAEAQVIETSFSIAPDTQIEAFYALAGWRATEKLHFYVMYEDSKNELRGGPFGDFDIDPLYEDLAASVTYHVSPNLVLRLEAHRFETTSPDVLLPPEVPTARTDFGIFSVSVSF